MTSPPEGYLPSELPPELVFPFTLQPQSLAQRLQGFTQGIPYPPADLSPENLQKRLQKVFIPAWLVDAGVRASWQAEVGFNYAVVSHQEKYSDTPGRLAHPGGQGDARALGAAPGQAGAHLPEYRPARRRERPRPAAQPVLSWSLPAPGPMPLRWRERLSSVCPPAAARTPGPTPCPASRRWRRRNAARQPAPTTCAISAGRRTSSARTGPSCSSRCTPPTTWTMRVRRNPCTSTGRTVRSAALAAPRPNAARRRSLTILIVAAVIFMLSLLLALAGAVVPPLLAVGGVGLFAAALVALAAGIPALTAWQFNRSQ